MKKKFYRLFYLAAFLVFSVKLFAQCNRPLLSYLENGEALNRLTLFSALKKNIYRSINIKDPGTSVDVRSIKDVLRKLRNRADDKDYDGVRVYFLHTDRAADGSAKIAYLLVPTKPAGTKDSCGTPISVDDTSSVYLLKDGVFSTEIDRANAAFWYIRRWQAHYEALAGLIESNVRISESKSIWYSKQMLYYFEGARKVDLLSYLDGCATVTKINISHGCWNYDQNYTDYCENYFTKTDLIFELVGAAKQLADIKYFTLGGREVSYNLNQLKKGVKIYKKRFGFLNASIINTTYTDTGLPCPPNKCN